MTDREKLIELLRYGMDKYFLLKFEAEIIADLLIANGVTFATDTAIAYKMSPTADGLSATWVSVDERLPEIVSAKKSGNNTYRRSERVLCACLQADGKRMVKEGYMEFFNGYPELIWRIPGTIHSVTHWMPLPEPPR